MLVTLLVNFRNKDCKTTELEFVFVRLASSYSHFGRNSRERAIVLATRQ